MLKRFKILLKAGIVFAGCTALMGLAQATTLAPVVTYSGNTSWQDIKGTTYTFLDANHDGKINVGEKVTFTVDMHKNWWGTHAFDALKVWIDGTPVNPPATTFYTNQFEWNYDPTHNNQKFYNKPGDTYSQRTWSGGDKFFSFDYTFNTTGIFDLTASVMCSRDLSGLSGIADDKPTQTDWNAWKENIHLLSPYLQGETERYQLAVVASPVPEPKTYGMLIVGLGLIGAVARRRKV